MAESSNPNPAEEKMFRTARPCPVRALPTHESRVIEVVPVGEFLRFLQNNVSGDKDLVLVTTPRGTRGWVSQRDLQQDPVAFAGREPFLDQGASLGSGNGDDGLAHRPTYYSAVATVLRASPRADAQPLATIPKGKPARLFDLGPAQSGDFIRVAIPSGLKGWVWKHDLVEQPVVWVDDPSSREVDNPSSRVVPRFVPLDAPKWLLLACSAALLGVSIFFLNHATAFHEWLAAEIEIERKDRARLQKMVAAQPPPDEEPEDSLSAEVLPPWLVLLTKLGDKHKEIDLPKAPDPRAAVRTARRLTIALIVMSFLLTLSPDRLRFALNSLGKAGEAMPIGPPLIILVLLSLIFLFPIQEPYVIAETLTIASVVYGLLGIYKFTLLNLVARSAVGAQLSAQRQDFSPATLGGVAFTFLQLLSSVATLLAFFRITRS